MTSTTASDYLGKHRPFADRCSYQEWTDMIVNGQTRDNVAKLIGYDYEPMHGHDELCEAEFISGPMSYAPCGCTTRRIEAAA